MTDEPFLSIYLPDEAATAELATQIARTLRPGDVVALHGDLGVGKTSLARAIIRSLGYIGDVPSPTFTLMQIYETDAGAVAHFDLYRLQMPDELVELNWDEALASGISLVEWPERAGALLPNRRLDVTLRYGSGATGRTICLQPSGGWGGLAALQGAIRAE